MTRRLAFIGVVACCLFAASASRVVAQQPVTGTPPLSSIATGALDSVDLANLNVHFSIPIFSRPGKGVSLHYSLSYDGLIWSAKSSGGIATWSNATNWGWKGITEASIGYVTYTYTNQIQRCGGPDDIYAVEKWSDWIYHDSAGTPHPFGGHIQIGDGCGNISYSTAIALDNSGYVLHLPVINSGDELVTTTVTSRDGLTHAIPSLVPTGSGTVKDPQNNTLTVTTNGSTTTINDTLSPYPGPAALTIVGAPPNDVTYTYPAPSQNASVTVHYVQYWVKTCFGVSGIQDYTSTQQVPLIDNITLPDGYYQFTYESTVTNGSCVANGQTTGRIKSIRLPTGGTITYTYGNTNTMMADGSPSTFTWNWGGGTWTYTRAYQNPILPSAQTTTTVAAPDGNKTDFKFSGIYETERKVWSGDRQTLLNYSFRCYNTWNSTDQSACPAGVVSGQVTRVGVYNHFNVVATDHSSLYGWTDSHYDTYGNETSRQDWNFGTGSSNASLRKIVTIYNTTLCTNNNICDRPASVEVTTDGTTRKAYTTYGYDESPGLLTSVTRWVSSTSPSLLQQYHYNNTDGTLLTATDPNTTQTQYTYNPSVCNGAFPTSVSVPASGGGNITTNYSYDCSGGVVTQVTDVSNGNVSISTLYDDANFWRPHTVTDQTGKTTTYTYPAVGQVESVMLFNGNNSTYDFVSTADAYGRPWMQQKRQGPSPDWTTFDTVITGYDTSGRVASVSQPQTCGLADSNCTGHTLYRTTTVYDGAGRPLTVTASDTDTPGTVNYTYAKNDVLVAVGPQATNENLKKRNFEYDLLGRLTSVCEVLGSGASGCGTQQSPPAYGYMTTYGYDALGNLLTVNQSGQTRAYTYDGLSRLLTESNPETAAISYTYDTETTSCNSSSKGDMVKKVVGTGSNAVTCFYYDNLHRVVDAGNGYEGPNAVCRRFRYDNMTPVGTPPANISTSNRMGRLWEVATDNCGDIQNHPVLTKEFFTYNARGETTDFYEWTKNLNDFYQVTSTYWDNGLVNTVSGIPGVPTITYTANEGGRPYKVMAGASQYLISNAAYNAAGQLLNMTYGSGDSDTLNYYTDTLRYKKYDFNFGITQKHVTGDLTWNHNGTLAGLVITDGNDSTKSQTCGYTYDDLSRIATVNCTNSGQNVFNQVFGYPDAVHPNDAGNAFGNVYKTVPQGGTGFEFKPTYAANNQYLSIPGVSGTLYDSYGNLINDGAHTYSWDPNWGNMAGVDSTTLTFDGLGRMVEKKDGTTYTQILYGPTGEKLAIMNGATLQKAFIPLLGGAQAIYNTSGLSSYRHVDWLGSNRLTTSAITRYALSDTAYAPFGETYNLLSSDKSYFSFTGQNQDTAGGIYNFLFREQSPVQGRWLSPDPAGLGAVDISDPQTWNRYAYVRNNPLNAVDPLGLMMCMFAEDGTMYCPGGSGSSGMPDGSDPNRPVLPDDCKDGSGHSVPCANRPSGCGKDVSGEPKPCPDPINSKAYICTMYPWSCMSGPLKIRPDVSGGAAVSAAPPKPPVAKPQKAKPGCMTGRLIHNFGGNDARAGVTVTVNIAAGIALRKIGTKAAAAFLPGPGWLYAGAATLYDLGMIGEAYLYCQSGASESGGNSEAEDD